MTNFISEAINSLKFLNFSRLYRSNIFKPMKRGSEIAVFMLPSFPFSLSFDQIFEFFAAYYSYVPIFDSNCAREKSINIFNDISFEALKDHQ